MTAPGPGFDSDGPVVLRNAIVIVVASNSVDNFSTGDHNAIGLGADGLPRCAGKVGLDAGDPIRRARIAMCFGDLDIVGKRICLKDKVYLRAHDIRDRRRLFQRRRIGLFVSHEGR